MVASLGGKGVDGVKSDSDRREKDDAGMGMGRWAEDGLPGRKKKERRKERESWASAQF